MARLILPYQQVFDLNGSPLPGAKFYFYESGTTTPKDTYSDEALTTPNANPVIADSQGQFGDIFLSGAYSCKLTDADDVTQPDYPGEIEASADSSSTVLLTGAQTVAGVKTFTDRLAVKADEPTIEIEENDAAANNRLWQFVAVAEQFIMRVANDARGAFASIFTIDRTDNTVDSIDFLATDIKHNGVKVYAAIDEDTMVSDSDVLVPTQQSVKAYVDSVGGVQVKIVDIGDWDMDANASTSVAHGLTASTIRSVTALIRNDGDTLTYDFNYDNTSGSSLSGITVGTTAINLNRATGGQFDSTAFDSTSYNRGWVSILYTN
jgi:hypothetical protein